MNEQNDWFGCKGDFLQISYMTQVRLCTFKFSSSLFSLNTTPSVNSMGDELNNLIHECYPQASTIERERIAFDLQNLQFALPHMQLTLEPYTSDRGDTRMLIKVFVTIPITFKGGRYNIPVDIWISEGYPRYPPKVYVAPTSDMQIKQGHKHVDINGLV